MAAYKVFAIRLNEDDIKFLDDIAKDKQVGRSAVIRWAIDDYRKSLFLPDCPIDSSIVLEDLAEDSVAQPA